MTVRVTGLRKSYGGNQVLRGVGLAVEEGSLTAVLGSSGSGKTTLLRILAGFERADAGAVHLGETLADDGRRSLAPEQRRIGYVPQDGALFPHLTVRGNIGFALTRAQRRGAKVDRLLEMTGLGGLGARYPHELSGGQQQRVALARALAHEPTVVLLDEPFSALDATLRASVRAEILGVLRAAGSTAVLVTHDQDEALSMADRVAVLRDGVIVQHGSPYELYTTPVDQRLARFIGEANLVGGTITGAGQVDAGPLGVLALRPDGTRHGTGTRPGACTVLIRPEQLALTDSESGPDTVGARVERTEYFGHDMMLTLRPRDRDGRLPELLSVRLSEGVRRTVGDAVNVTVRGPVIAWSDASAPAVDILS